MGGPGSGKPAGYGKTKSSIKTSDRSYLEKKYGKVSFENKAFINFTKNVKVASNKISESEKSIYGKTQLAEKLKANKVDISYDAKSDIYTYYTKKDPSKSGRLDESKPSKVYYKVSGGTVTQTTTVFKDGKKGSKQSIDFSPLKGNKLEFEVVGTKL